MASISTDSKGNRTIQFVGADRKRRSVRLGKASLRVAESIKVRVEALNIANITGHPVDVETARWVSERDVMLLEKLAAVKLIHPREPVKAVSLGEFLDAYVARRSDVKAGTQTFYSHTIRNLLDLFGTDRPLTSITAGDADDFRRHLLNEHDWKSNDGKRQKRRALSEATVARRCGLAQTFFKDAVRRKLIDANPFADIESGNKANPERQHFIDRDTIAKVFDACPNAEWRLLVALSRFGGVRIPSEALTLRWCDIDWSANRMTIHSPKTEHHVGKATRVVPIFPELRPYLEDVFDQAAVGSEFVLPSLQREAAQLGDWRAVNLRTRFQKIVKKAGLTPWPRLWHNLRASRQTELEEQFPSHVVCAWLGNSEAVARKHYLQVRETDFQKATQKATQHTAASGDFEAHTVTTNAKTLGKPRVSVFSMGDTGFEPVTSTV